jgi:hypothetical protein
MLRFLQRAGAPLAVPRLRHTLRFVAQARAAPPPRSLLDMCQAAAPRILAAPAEGETVAAAAVYAQRCGSFVVAVNRALASSAGQPSDAVLLELDAPLLAIALPLVTRAQRGAAQQAWLSRDAKLMLASWVTRCAGDVAAAHHAEIFVAAMRLQLPCEAVALTRMARNAVKAPALAALPSGRAAVTLLTAISRAFAQSNIDPPNVAPLIARMHIKGATVDAEGALRVLTALSRLRDRRFSESTFTFSLRVAHGIDGLSTAAVLQLLGVFSRGVNVSDRCAEAMVAAAAARAPAMTAAEVGRCCAALVRCHKAPERRRVLLDVCGSDMRRLLPALVGRTERLVGGFDLEQARAVVACLELYKQRSSLIFSRLSTVVKTGDHASP